MTTGDPEVDRLARLAKRHELRRTSYGCRCETCGVLFAWVKGTDFVAQPRTSSKLLEQAAAKHCAERGCDGPVVIVRALANRGGGRPPEKIGEHEGYRPEPKPDPSNA